MIGVKKENKRETRLMKNIEEQILDDAERKYLSAVCKPFASSIMYIKKIQIADEGGQFIRIRFCNYDCTDLPIFEEGAMYKGMEADKEYTPEELGL